MIPSDLTYDFPGAAYLLLLTPIVLWMFWRLSVYRKDKLTMTALPKMIISRSSVLFWIRSLFFLLAWVFAVLALMQPKGDERYPQGAPNPNKKSKSQLSVQRKAHDIILLIDASASMGVPDARNKLTRLEHAKEIADEFISRLKGENIAVYAFTSEPSKISPLTLDYLFARLMIKDIKINEGGIAGTNFLNAISKLKQEYFADPVPRLKTVVVISDGGDTDIESLEGPQKEEAIQKVLSHLQNAEALHLRVYTIGVGSKSGGQVPGVTEKGKAVSSSLNEAILSRMSSIGRGQYYASHQLSLVDLISKLQADMAQDSPYMDDETLQRSYSLSTDQKIYTYYYYWPLSLALICLLIALFLPETKLWALLLLVSTSSLYGDALPPYVQEKMLHATREAEAGAYLDALDSYLSVLELPLESWQRNIVLYNQGTILLTEKKYVDAIQKFVAIPDFKDMPLLKRRLYTNLAIAQLELSRETIKEPESSRKAQFLLLRAQESLNQAMTADCQVERLEGSKECAMPFDIDEIALAIRQELSTVLTQVHQEKLHNLSLEEGVAALYRAIDQFDHHLKLLDQTNTQLKGNYSAFVVAEGDSWLPLWNELKGKITDSKQLTLYEEARKLYAYAIRFVEKGNATTSRGGILEARQKLDAFAKAQWGANSSIVLLHKLEAMLKMDLDQAKLILSDVIASNDELSRLLKMQSDPSLESIQKQLSKAIEYLQADKQIQARMFTLSAWHSLKKQLKQVNNNPNSILEAAIDQQQQAVSLNMLFLLLDKAQRSDDLASLLKQAQQQTIVAADPYLKAVKEEQIKKYQDGICQCNPWKDVLPLFNSGFREALNSRKKLNDQILNSNLALLSQDQTLKDWQAALNQFSKPVQEEQKTEQKQEQKDQEHKDQQDQMPQDEDKQLPSSTNDILQTLQDMQRADVKPKGQQTVTTEGVKPW